MLRGSLTALVTPFDKSGRFDEKAFRAFIEWQLAEGTTGLVPVGTTGESPTLSHDEHRQVVKVCIEVAKGRAPVVAGAGSNNTEEAVGLVQYAEKAGAPMPPLSSRLIITGRRSAASTSTSPPSQGRPSCRSSSTTSRRVR